MNKQDKFLFNLHNFDATQVEEEIVEEEVYVEPPPPTFSEDELEAAKAVAHATGRNEGMQEEREQREQKISHSLSQISENFSALFAAEIYREKQYEEEALKLALQIIHTLAPSLQSRLGAEALKHALHEVLEKQSDQSEVKIEVHPETAPDIDKLIEEIWPDKDSAPRYKILASTSMEIGACSLTWKDGGMVRNPEKTAENIKAAIEGLLVEQVMGKSNSSLTSDQNHGINKEESSDSSEIHTEDTSTGEENNE